MADHRAAGSGPGTRPLVAGPRPLDLSDPHTLRCLRDLQRASYAVEAELIGFDGIPALQESLEELRDCGESFLGLHDETGLAGAVSWVRLPDGTLDICRLMVHPRAHRRGIATVLLDSLDRAEPPQRAVASTGRPTIPPSPCTNGGVSSPPARAWSRPLPASRSWNDTALHPGIRPRTRLVDAVSPRIPRVSVSGKHRSRVGHVA